MLWIPMINDTDKPNGYHPYDGLTASDFSHFSQIITRQCTCKHTYITLLGRLKTILGFRTHYINICICNFTYVCK